MTYCTNFMDKQSILISHGFHICKFFYLLNFLCKPKSNTELSQLSEDTRSSENFVLPDAHIPSWGQTRSRSAFLFQFLWYKRVPFSRSAKCQVFTSLCFLLVILLCNMAPNIKLKSPLVFLSARRLWCSSHGTICVRQVVHTSVTALRAVSSMLMNIVNKASKHKHS